MLRVFACGIFGIGFSLVYDTHHQNHHTSCTPIQPGQCIQYCTERTLLCTWNRRYDDVLTPHGNCTWWISGSYPNRTQCEDALHPVNTTHSCWRDQFMCYDKSANAAGTIILGALIAVGCVVMCYGVLFFLEASIKPRKSYNIYNRV